MPSALRTPISRPLTICFTNSCATLIRSSGMTRRPGTPSGIATQRKLKAAARASTGRSPLRAQLLVPPAQDPRPADSVPGGWGDQRSRVASRLRGTVLCAMAPRLDSPGVVSKQISALGAAHTSRACLDEDRARSGWSLRLGIRSATRERAPSPASSPRPETLRGLCAADSPKSYPQ